MRFSLTSLIRLIALGALISSTAAVGLSRLVPAPSVVLTEAPPRYACINGSSFDPVVSGSYLLDTEAGVLSPLGPVDGVAIEYANCSPWSDGRNLPEFVGRATIRGGQDSQSHCQQPWQVQASAPVLTVLEHVPIKPTITGRPCWLPGKSSRIVFPTGDGLLHVEDLHGASNEPETRSSWPIVWSCPILGNEDTSIMLSDPVSPVVPSLGGRLFVIMSYHNKRDRKQSYRSEIWWLKLDTEGRTIVAAGPVSTLDARSVEKRLPNVGATSDGRLVLAYLARPSGGPNWQMKLTTLSVDPVTGAPTADVAETRDLGSGFGMTPPAFSPDGRWVYGIPRCQPTPVIVQRFSVLDALKPTSEGLGDR